MGCTLARRRKNPRNVTPSWTLHGVAGVGTEWPCNSKDSVEVEAALAFGSCDPTDPLMLGVLMVGKIQCGLQGKPQ